VLFPVRLDVAGDHDRAARPPRGGPTETDRPAKVMPDQALPARAASASFSASTPPRSTIAWNSLR
jgi:hypothetical protein